MIKYLLVLILFIKIGVTFNESVEVSFENVARISDYLEKILDTKLEEIYLIKKYFK